MDEPPRIASVHSRVEEERCVVSAMLDDDTEVQLLAYFPGKVSFGWDELVRLTVDEARHLHFRRDRAYLRAGGRRLRRTSDAGTKGLSSQHVSGGGSSVANPVAASKRWFVWQL